MRSQMPNETLLDGEVWFGRNQFAEALRLVNAYRLQDMRWSMTRVVVVDSPTPVMAHAPHEYYSLRYARLVANIPADHPFLVVAPHWLCLGNKHALNATNEVSIYYLSSILIITS